MQIILTQEECQIIHEALQDRFISLADEMMKQRRGGRIDDILHKESKNTNELRKRFEPYLEEKK